MSWNYIINPISAGVLENQDMLGGGQIFKKCCHNLPWWVKTKFLIQNWIAAKINLFLAAAKKWKKEENYNTSENDDIFLIVNLMLGSIW